MNIVVSGCCGFIGYHLSKKLLESGHTVIGIDNMNSYYDVELKNKRLDEIKCIDNFVFNKADICDYEALSSLFSQNNIDIVINLAAQAGVRYSIENPSVYIQSNIAGFFNILECCRNFNIDRLIYASSSSVYGNSDDIPFKESAMTDNPVSLYAATKKCDEILAQSYSNLYGIQCIGLRFFTVYGPSGRPDMAPVIFAKAIDEGKEIKVFNNGNMLRDFTYVDDVVNGIISIVENDNGKLYGIYNIGCGNPVNLMDFIKELEKNLGKKANVVYMPIQKGDVTKTYADCSRLKEDYNYIPSVKTEEGVKLFIEWFKKNKEDYA